jgi:hypothetical protein
MDEKTLNAEIAAFFTVDPDPPKSEGWFRLPDVVAATGMSRNVAKGYIDRAFARGELERSSVGYNRVFYRIKKL